MIDPLHPDLRSAPSLRWEPDSETGVGFIVHLDGLPKFGITADGQTVEEALHRLGDILFHAFKDACMEPEAHPKCDQDHPPPPDLQEVERDATRLLKAITPGEWEVAHDINGPGEPDESWVQVAIGDDEAVIAITKAERKYEDAEFIAAAPRLIRGLLAVLAVPARQPQEGWRAIALEYGQHKPLCTVHLHGSVDCSCGWSAHLPPPPKGSETP